MDKTQNTQWLQITAGQGPKECGWVVAQVFQLMMNEASRYAVNAEIVEQQPYDKLLHKQGLIEADALMSVVIQLKGNDANVFCERWLGTIQWKGESCYRPKHKRQNWYIGVQQVPERKAYSVGFDQLQREVRFEVMRSGGPGGQHVNKTSSAVRATHLPSGLQVRVETERSQHRNKQLALSRLQSVLAAQADDISTQQNKGRWLKHFQVDRGNPRRTFIGADFKEAL